MSERPDPAEATLPNEAAEPTEPIDSTEPTEPMLSSESFDAMESIAPSDHSDQNDLPPSTRPSRLPVRRPGPRLTARCNVGRPRSSAAEGTQPVHGDPESGTAGSGRGSGGGSGTVVPCEHC